MDIDVRLFLFHWRGTCSLSGLLVDAMFISYGDTELPKHPSELVDYLKSLPEPQIQPAWVRDTISMLCENADQAFVNHQVGCEWQYRVSILE